MSLWSAYWLNFYQFIDISGFTDYLHYSQPNLSIFLVDSQWVLIRFLVQMKKFIESRVGRYCDFFVKMEESCQLKIHYFSTWLLIRILLASAHHYIYLLTCVIMSASSDRLKAGVNELTNQHALPSVLLTLWLSITNSILPLEIEWCGVGMVVWSEVQIVYISGVTSHRQPWQCRGAQGPKMVKAAQSHPNYVSRLLLDCVPVFHKIITPAYLLYRS